MLLVLHILTAVSGLVVATLAVLRPGSLFINASYALLSGTLISGTALVFVADANILRTCLNGLLYTAVMFGGIRVAKHRLATVEEEISL